MGKVENAGNQHFPFCTMFSTCQRQILSLQLSLICRVQIFSKILSFGKALRNRVNFLYSLLVTAKQQQ